MPRLELRVESGENAHNSIDTQNGNIFWLRNIFDFVFQNENNDILHNIHAIQVNTDPTQEPSTHFTNPNDTTTSVLYVEIPEAVMQVQTNELNNIKQDLNTNFQILNFPKLSVRRL